MELGKSLRAPAVSAGFIDVDRAVPDADFVYRGAGRLHIHLLENAAWNAADHEHDEAPEGRRVDNVLTFFDSADDVFSDLGRLGEERVLGEMRGHGRRDEAGLDGENLHTGAVDAVADT